MDTTFQPIDHRTLIAMLRAKRSQRVHAYAQKAGWSLVLRNRKVDWTLVGDDDHIKVFVTLDGLKNYLYDIAVSNFLVDISALDSSADDPETRERLREAREVAEHDEWMRQLVQEALDDPSPSVPNTVVEERAAARRAELLAKLDQKKS